MAPTTVRKNGKAFTKTERQRRWRARKRTVAKLEQEAMRQARCLEVAGELNICPVAIADITEDDLASGSVAAVVTDPPYDEGSLKVYEDLGRFAMRVLKPAGWCVVLTGTMYLPIVTESLLTTGLRYSWQLVATFPGGPHSRISSRSIFQSYKPVLVFQKPPLGLLPEWGPDLIALPITDQAKDLHRWQQSKTLFSKLVERFSGVGDLIADPFAGSGTTLKAAIDLGRHAWGGDDGSSDLISSRWTNLPANLSSSRCEP